MTRARPSPRRSTEPKSRAETKARAESRARVEADSRAALLALSGLPAAPHPPGARIGLLGGSFNPPHDGHRHLSRLACAHLGLHEIWWLVTPQNPLKPARGMAPLPQRLVQARAAARRARARGADLARVRATDIEARLGTRYTIDSVRALKRLYPRVRFVLVIGADNLAQLVRWRGWKQLFAEVPIAIFDRPTYAAPALDSAAAEHFARWRLDARWGAKLADRLPPAWVFFRTALDPTSSTALRARRAKSERQVRLTRMASSKARTSSQTGRKNQKSRSTSSPRAR
ncbi:MAG: nicotinate-nucleotide adenylyltransferase [Alphaproteobacteria bacterium]